MDTIQNILHYIARRSSCCNFCSSLTVKLITNGCRDRGRPCTGAGIDFSLAQSSVAAPNAGTLGSAAYAVAQAALNAAQSAIATQVNQIETTINSVFSSDETSANAFAGDLSAAGAAAQRLAVLLNGGVYISRAARNLLNASS